MQQNWQLLQQELKRQISQQVRQVQTGQQMVQSSQQMALSNQQLISQQALLTQQLHQALTTTQQKVKQLSGRQKQDWLLAEAEYLIKLAQLKISLEKDKTTAVALLKTADQRVLEIADNSLQELRQVIAQDIVDLQLVAVPDIGGIASQLQAISAHIPQLDLIALEFEPLRNNAQATEKTVKEFSWSDFYKDFLDDFVTVKEHSKRVEPLMTLQQRSNLNANIQLALQQAQIALVRGEPSLYSMNLDNAVNWIGEFFQHSQSAKSLLDNLGQLRDIPINIQFPQALAAKAAIQEINRQRLYQWLEQGQGPEQISAPLSPELPILESSEPEGSDAEIFVPQDGESQ